jgi:hypothetical protein
LKIAHVVILCAALGAVAGQGLTDDEVSQAIAAAKQAAWKSMFVEAKGRFAADYSVVLQGPVGRTMDIAREAFDSYKPIPPSAIGPSVRAREITFAVLRHSEGSGFKNVVVIPPTARDRDDAIQPIPFQGLSTPPDVLPRTWKPGYGTDLYGGSIFRRFALANLPEGDLTIIVVTETRDERYVVKAAERDRLR